MKPPENGIAGHGAFEPLTTAGYWGSFFGEADIEPGFAYFDDVAAHLPTTNPGTAFMELGCGPGGILAEFCRRCGYEAHGIDYSCDAKRVRLFLERCNVRVGEIHSSDILQWKAPRRYEIVASFGFVEHFGDAAAVVDLHFSMVQPGGLVIVGLPNFAHGQWLLHWLFDRPRLRSHNIACMNLGFLRAAAQRNRAETLRVTYAGGPFEFWFDRSAHRGRFQNTLMWRTLGLTKRLADSFLPRRNALLSPYILGVFKAHA